MRKRSIKLNQFVVCIDNKQYPASLELFKIYRVLKDSTAIKDGDLRIIDESGEDYLYPNEIFFPIEVPSELKNNMMNSSVA